MKQLLLSMLVILCLSSMLYAQKDTVSVEGYYQTGGTYGTLNDAIEGVIANSEMDINNTVFKLAPYEIYVLSRSIFLDHGQNLEIVAPEPLRAGEADAETVQNSAPPQIVWTEEEIDRAYLIQSYGDIVMKNIWVRHADLLGNQVSSSITFENQEPADEPESGYFDGCIFDYAGIGAEAGGAITVKADHFDGEFHNTYFRNLSDIHFRYYGRAISFPFESTGWHYDRLLFENCTFTNIARIVMQEGNEYSDNVHINHCTMLNSLEWVFQSAGWIRNASITNSIFVNPNALGFQVVAVCDDGQDLGDYLDGDCPNSPGGGLINGITPVDSFGFTVDFTDYDRKIFIGNNVYVHQDWLKDWYTAAPIAQTRIRNRESDLVYQPSPMLGEDEIAFIDSTDENGEKVFTTMNVDWATIYDVDPEFVVPATNLDTIKTFINYKWDNNADVQWAYKPEAGFNQVWPLPENLAYNNTEMQSAAMGGFPLGDLNWYPDELAPWAAQRDAEWQTINNWLEFGTPDPSSVDEVTDALPGDYALGQNYPNPFNPTTNIEYSIPTNGHVSLKIYNNLGQEIATLFEGTQQAGSHVVTFDGSVLASGIYLYRLQSGNTTITKKLALIK